MPSGSKRPTISLSCWSARMRMAGVPCASRSGAVGAGKRPAGRVGDDEGGVGVAVGDDPAGFGDEMLESTEQQSGGTGDAGSEEQGAPGAGVFGPCGLPVFAAVGGPECDVFGFAVGAAAPVKADVDAVGAGVADCLE